MTKRSRNETQRERKSIGNEMRSRYVTRGYFICISLSAGARAFVCTQRSLLFLFLEPFSRAWLQAPVSLSAGMRLDSHRSQ